MTTSKTYSVKQFAEMMGYSATYVRHCCNGYVNPQTGRQYRLPSGWKARREGPEGRKYWVIYKIKSAKDSGNLSVTDRDEAALRDRLIEAGWSRNVAAREAAGIVQGSRFSEARVNLFMQDMGLDPGSNDPVIREIGARLQSLIPKLLLTTRDDELAEILARRWQHGVSIETMEDCRKYLPFAEGKAAALGGASGQPISDPSGLLARIGACYRTSVARKKKLSVKLEFYEMGAWQFSSLEPRDEPLLEEFLRNAGAKEPIESIFHAGDRLEQLFYTTWRLQIHERRRAVANNQPMPQRWLDEWLRTPYVLNNPHCDEFLSRCLFCGKHHGKKRPDAHYCDSTHRSGHSDWIAEQAQKSERNTLQALAQKLRKVLPVLRKPNLQIVK